MHISELETPALLIDLDIFEKNLERVASYAKLHDLRLRPHTKTHKVPEIGRMQLALGAAGLTVAKVGEAEVMVQSGTPDLLVAYPVIGRSKLLRLMALARETRVTVSLDSEEAARRVSEVARECGVTVGVLAEMDVGLGRIGVVPGALLGLAQSIERMPHLTLEGITFYPHVKKLDDTGRQAFVSISAIIRDVLDQFRQAGIEVKIVSGGSTPTLFHCHEMAGLNEIRPGTYVYNDINTYMLGECALEDCAASMMVTVVSSARPGTIIIDGGSKTFSSDRLITGGEPSFGRIVESPECVFHNMNEEHGFVDTRRAGRDFSVGERLRVIPNHVCAAVNLHEKVYGIRGETVEKIWTVEGRGKLQ